MFNRILPDNCPPEDAFSEDKVLYRIFNNNNLSESEFIPYTDLEPDNERYKFLCKAYAVSFYTTLESAYKAYLGAYKRNKILGNFIAKLKVVSDVGKMYSVNGIHYSIWLFNKNSIEGISCEEIISIEDYEKN